MYILCDRYILDSDWGHDGGAPPRYNRYFLPRRGLGLALSIRHNISYLKNVENLKILHSEVYLDLSHIIHGVYIYSSLIEVYKDFSFRKYI